MEIVEVIWLDAGLEETQLNAESASKLEPLLRKNVGYLQYADDIKVILYFGIIEDADHDGKSILDKILVIPRSLVQKIRRLK